MKTIKFYLDQKGFQETVYRNPNLSRLAREAAEKSLSEARAAFLQTFGTDGEFNLQFVWARASHPAAPAGALRPVYRIVAADAKTGAILKKHPRWLDQFSGSAKL